MLHLAEVMYASTADSTQAKKKEKKTLGSKKSGDKRAELLFTSETKPNQRKEHN